MNNSIQNMKVDNLIPSSFHDIISNKDEDLETLEAFIKNFGILDPLIVRPKGNKYEIILGNKRYKVATKLGITEVPVTILNLDDKQALELILSKNTQTKELTKEQEANIYSKLLSYPDTTKENLSIDLGVPIDNIDYKLDKSLVSKVNSNLVTKPSLIDNDNNSVNNDIVNLADLNKEEKERDDYNMNQNQYTNNNVNNIPNNNISPQPQSQPQSQEPTFGGRFFPSLEDEPTNMNLGGNLNQQSTQMSTGSLIDLTDLDNTRIIDRQSIAEQLQENNNQPPLSNNSYQSISNNEVPTSNSEINQQPTQIQQPSLEQPLPSSLNKIPLYDNLHQEPNQQINNFDNLSQPQPNYQESINQNNNFIPQFNQPITTPNITNQMIEPNLTMPNLDLNLNDNVSNQGSQIPDNSYQSMPNNKVSNQNLEVPQQPTETNNYQETLNTNSKQEIKKDIVPVINMIKNLAIGLESLGYDLQVVEDENDNSYKITIEVEK